MSEAAASKKVYCGGLKIYTAMQPELQRIVTDYYENEENFPLHESGKRAQSGLLLVDPHTGDILAVAGAIGKKSSNRLQSFATDSKRPSGSVIKPLSVYAPALSRNLITYATVFDDIPLKFKENGAPWPRNAPNIYRGLTTINTAVKHSVNTVCVEVLQKLGMQNSYRFLTEKLGFYSLSEKNDLGAAALALGQQHTGVTLREIVGGYTALANDGVYTGTRSFYRVLDSNGNELLVNGGRSERVIERADAAILTLMLRGVVQEGTGRALTLKGLSDVAGKTGTTGKNCDKWFVGYTPELLCGVWYGHEFPAPLNDVKGNPALHIFDAVMHGVLEERAPQKTQFETPDDVIVVRYCKDSGMLPCEACLLDPRGDRLEYGYFKKGSEPRQRCDRHVCVEYCDHGGVALENCPIECRYLTALLRVKRSFPYRIAVEDAPYTWDGAPIQTERIFTYNEPYYAVKYNSKQNFGVGKDVLPYNRGCALHGVDDFWRRRADAG
jgi:penicillin-binding protein 1A